MTPATWGWIGRANVRVIPLKGDEFAIVSGEDYERVSAFRWHLLSKKQRYAASTLRVEEGPSHLLLHQLIMEPPAPLVVDHINWDGLDCRRSNMRVVTQAVNSQNRQRLGFLGGVTWHAGSRRWQVGFTIGGRRRTFGYYRTRDEAERVADEVADRLGTPRLARPVDAMPVANCAECGLPFTVTLARETVCSQRCERKRMTRDRRAGGLPSKTCAHCGTEFRPRHGRQKYCTDDCRKALGFQKWSAFGKAWEKADPERRRERAREYQARWRAKKREEQLA